MPPPEDELPSSTHDVPVQRRSAISQLLLDSQDHATTGRPWASTAREGARARSAPSLMPEPDAEPPNSCQVSPFQPLTRMDPPRALSESQATTGWPDGSSARAGR